jgi:hypothetical protein
MASITCPVCDLTYVPDVPADLAQHSERHAKVWSALHPQSDPSFLQAASETQGRPIFVCCASEQWKNKAVHGCSLAFACEMPQGAVAWPPNGDLPLTCQAYLFADDTHTIPIGAVAGACGFREVEYRDAPPIWRLEWIWLVPGVRRRGILTRQWEWLKSHHGEFDLVAVSDAMKSFCRKIGIRAYGL